MRALPTTCRAGHPYDKANTLLYAPPGQRARRYCRTCRRAAKRARKALARAARPVCPHCGAPLRASAATVKMIVPVAAIVAEPQLARRCAA